jgi:hypothetical protein
MESNPDPVGTKMRVRIRIRIKTTNPHGKGTIRIRGTLSNYKNLKNTFIES